MGGGQFSECRPYIFATSISSHDTKEKLYSVEMNPLLITFTYIKVSFDGQNNNCIFQRFVLIVNSKEDIFYIYELVQVDFG